MRNLAIAALAIVLTGCATIKTGDPLVIRVEQTQKVAESTIDFVLSIDEGDRGFWRTNAPAFHNFCEWLRAPAPFPPSLQRGLAIQKQVQDLKVLYKRNRTAGNSNSLYLAWTVLDRTIGQANAWSNITTRPIHY